MDQVDLVFRGFDPALRFFLEGVDHPDVVINLQGVDNPVRIAPVFQCQFHHAGAKPGQVLGDIRHLAFGQDRQCPRHFKLCPGRKLPEILPGGLEPADGAGVYHLLYVVKYDYICQGC